MTRRKRTRAAACGPRLGLETLEPRETPARAGLIDPTFATGGVFSPDPDPPLSDALSAAAVQPDGKVVAAGWTAGPSGMDFLVARLNPDGSPDPTFGTAGRVAIDFPGAAGGGDDRAIAVAVMADGRIVVGGSSASSTTPTLLVARLTPAGGLDPTFDTDGRASVGYGPSDPGPSTLSGGMAVDPLGRVVVVGSTSSGFGASIEVIRLTAAGQPDPGFGAGGRAALPNNPTIYSEYGYAVAVQADGKVVVGGTRTSIAPFKFQGLTTGWVRRLHADGSIDGTFSTFIGLTRVVAVAVQADGKVVVGGDKVAQFPNPVTTGPADFGVVRLNPDATPDATFGTNGRVTLDLGADDRAAAMAVGTDGRVILAGYSTADFPVARFDADGAPDAAFNAALGPEALARFGGSVAASGAAIQGDQIVVAASGVLTRLLGEPVLDLPHRLAVGGSADGRAVVYAPDAGGDYGSPAATVAPFAGFGGNVRAAVADVDGDGVEDTVLVTGPGTPIRVTVISGADHATVLVSPFDPFGGDFTGGGFVASADLDHDWRAEFAVTPDQGGGPRVSIFSRNADGSAAVRANFFGIDDPDFRGGARAALGDINGDGTPDLAVAAGFGGGPRTAIFDGTTLLGGTPARLANDFFAFPGGDAATLRNGVFVAAGDVDGDGFADLVFGGGPGGAPRVFILSGARVSAGDVAAAQASPLANFFVAGNSTDRGGVRVAAKDADGDNKADVAAGSGEGAAARVRSYLAAHFTGPAEPAVFQDLTVFGGIVLTGGVFVG